jgi:hypothetical protein
VGYTLSDLKQLFALSCNQCAYGDAQGKGCEERLANPAWEHVMAEISHIEGRRPGSARYNPAMSAEERDAYPNLILLCPTHHKLVDDLERDSHSAQRLRDMKARHEQRCAGTATAWASERDLDRFASALLRQIQPAADLRGISPPLRIAQPRLVVRTDSDHRVTVTNEGNGRALDLEIEESQPGPTAGFAPGVAPPRSGLPPGSSWPAGHHIATFGNAGPHEVRLRWRDEGGETYDEVFPIG